MGMQLGGGSQDQMVSEINVTPFVDVMLVLLIIFMVAAPMMTQGIDVNLPATSAQTISNEEERVVVSVTRDGRVYINDDQVEFEGLGSGLTAMYRTRRDKRSIFLKADEGINYGFVVKVMGAMHDAGIDQIGMVTAGAANDRDNGSRGSGHGEGNPGESSVGAVEGPGQAVAPAS